MSNTYTVEIHHQGHTHTLTVPEEQTILAARKMPDWSCPIHAAPEFAPPAPPKFWQAPSINPMVWGVSPALQSQGYALLCVSYPRSDLKIETEKEDTVYQLQFGQFQESKGKR